MSHVRRLRRCILIAWLLFAGCSVVTDSPPTRAQSTLPVVRVRLLEAQTRATLSANTDCWLATAGDSTGRRIHLYATDISLTPSGWRVGDVLFSSAPLTLESADSVLSINGHRYHGQLRFLPVGAGRFDVINDLDIDSYLKGVLPVELYGNWHPQTYAAQAVVARTYALYIARTEGLSRPWDLYPDTRSQMYGGISAETAKSRQAVDSTMGEVLTYGPGDGHLFEAYFSSCCGGITQTAALVFPGAPNIPPLAAQNNHNLCSASPNFTWPPVTIPKPELARRLRLWGVRQTPVRPEATIQAIYRVDLDAVNPLGRPARFAVTDVRGIRYVMNAEEFRTAVNTDATPGNTIRSSFCKIAGGPERSNVFFYDGHGSGHGVGMCQWCAEAQATMGMSYDSILSAAYPGAKIVRAY